MSLFVAAPTLPPLSSPAPLDPATTSTSIAAAIVGFAVGKGMPLPRIIEVTGLDLVSLLRPDTRVKDDAIGVLWTAIEKEFPGEAIGLQMAQAAPMSFLGPAVHVVRYAPTPRAALEVFVRCRAIASTDVQLTVHEGPEETVVAMHHPLDDVRYVGAAPESVLGLSVRFHREVLGTGHALRRVELAHQPDAPRRIYEDFFGVEVRFGQRANATVLATAELDRPIEGADRLRFDAMLAHLDALHQPASAIASAELQRVQQAIANNAHEGEFGAEALAKRLGTSLRSLERLARSHDTTVRRLLDDARQSHARRLLRDPRLSMEEISCRLGYSAESAFRRAFKRWCGMSPGAYRRSS